MIAATADAKVDTQPFNSSITTVPRKNETKKRVLIDSKDSEMKRVKVAFNVEQEQTIEAANLNRIVINDPDKKDERNDPGPHDLVNFLRNLEHDLSHLATDLDRQGIKTLAHLVAFASWSEEKLHELFQATLPYLTVPQRFILVHGVKGRAV
ncbi:hypothetical protein H0H93_016155 [Arthromyces matolae]|nr:hypothetical protein H0H93_016155 [Arthromyces matolae]